MKVTKKRGRLRVEQKGEDFDPMEGMANLADVMLVFACGLLLALIINWNVDVSSTAPQEDPQSKYEIEGVDDNSSQTIDGEDGLEEMGKVYKDPKTGKYYIVEGE